MKTYIAIKFWCYVKWIIRRGYGCNCKGSDLVDFPEWYTKPEHVFASGRCASCRAKEVIDWIDKHIELIQ